jgi:hypothetical protein
MRARCVITVFLLTFLLIATVSGAGTTTTSSSGTSTSSASSSQTLSPEQALAQVYVSSVSVNPEVFFPFEDGTITVQLTNSGSQSVAFVSADLIDNNIVRKDNNPYNTVIYIGPGNTMTYTFLVTAKPPDGTYFPLFTAASRDATSIRYPVRVDIDSADPIVSIAETPDNFALFTKARVNLSVINPRSGQIDRIIITPKGTGFDVSPSQQFISSLAAAGSAKISFDITPHQQSDVTFHVSYHNGLSNERTMDVVLPLNIGENKQAAIPVINNIAITSSGSYYTLTGDVNNAGITDAKAVVVTVGSPAHATEPYPEYAIGSLASDDFSSFEVTLTASDLSSVPLVIRWKDADGNSFSTTKTLDLRSGSDATGTGSVSSTRSSSSGGSTATGSRAGGFSGGPQGGGGVFAFGGSRGGGISAFYPVIAGGIILAVAIVLWVKRKWIAGKFRKK